MKDSCDQIATPESVLPTSDIVNFYLGFGIPWDGFVECLTDEPDLLQEIKLFDFQKDLIQ